MKNKKILITGILVIAISIIGILVAINYKPQTPIEKNTELNLEDSVIRKSVDEVDEQLELADKEKAIVVQIKDKEKLAEFDALFDRAYQNDMVIFLPNQTIIYDSSTKTIRDISSESFYEEVTK